MAKLVIALSLFGVLFGCSPKKNKTTYFQKGNEYYSNNELDSAEFWFKKSIRANEKIGESYFQLGNIFYVGGYYFDYVNYEKLDSSIENYWSAVRFGYVNDSLIDGLLRCYHWESDLNLKKESLTKLTSLNPNHINVLYNRAEARKELAKFQLAVEDYERVKSLDIENHFDYHLPYYTGHMHYLLGDSIKSKQYFERALKMSKRLTLRPYDDWAKNVKMWEENNKVN